MMSCWNRQKKELLRPRINRQQLENGRSHWGQVDGFMERIKDINNAVKEYTDKTLTLKQIERLEAIRDKLVEQDDRMTQSYE